MRQRKRKEVGKAKEERGREKREKIKVSRSQKNMDLNPGSVTGQLCAWSKLLMSWGSVYL